jgi:hypothetical protein
MRQGSARLLRENAFLVAAVCLPLLVVVFFVLASIIPRWLVAPPAYDLLLRVSDRYMPTNTHTTIDFAVRAGVVEVVVRATPPTGWGSRARLFLFDHTTMSAQEIPVLLPEPLEGLKEGDPPRTRTVEALAGRRVLDQLKAPDGYRLENRGSGGAGIVGELFGMHRYASDASLVNRGRVIAIKLPLPTEDIYYAPASFLGWLDPRSGATQR